MSRLEHEHRLACAEGSTLETRLAATSSQCATLEAQLFDARSKTEDCEDTAEAVVERLESYDPSGEVADLQKEQARGVKQALDDKSTREAELNKLLVQNPKIEAERRAQEEADLRLANHQELAFAQRKVNDIMREKQRALDQATATLKSLREETNCLKQKLDTARRQSLSGMRKTKGG